MASNRGMGILRLITVILGVGMLALVVLTAGMTFMPGTKIGHVFTLPPETLEGHEPVHPKTKTMTMAQWAAGTSAPDAGTKPDAGTVEAQALPEQQGR
jgi:hypothetical protein